MTRESAAQESEAQDSVAQDWISGRFRGVYASERSGTSEGARRLPIQLQYGELADAEPGAGPPPGEDAEELRFAKLPRVKIASAESGSPDTERTLFDVRIRAWRLLYPAESARHIYGTLVGELSGRLTPEPVAPLPEPPRAWSPDPAPAPPAPEPKPADPAAEAASEPAPVAAPPLPRPPTPPAAQPWEATPEQDLERLLWLIVPVLLCVLGSALALACSPQSAGIWLAPIATAIAVRQTPARFRIQGTLARRWFGGLCVLAQIFVLLGPLQVDWTAGCRPSLRTGLPWLGAALVASALVRTQPFVWICAAIWTTAIAAWCGNLDGNCSAAALTPPARSVAQTPAPESVPAAPLPPPRTDPDGRWPASPAKPAQSPASLPGDAPPYLEISPSPPGTPSGSVARISLDQASRDPDAFFRPDGPSVYVPSDVIFEPGRPNLRSEGEVTLAQLGKLLALHPERRIVVEIHTDASSDAATQRALGRQRATALTDWLVRRGGVSARQLRFEAMGAAQPLVPSDGDYLEQRANRRLELRLAAE